SSGGAAIDPDRARAQHAAYRAALADLVEVVVLPADQELPDACLRADCRAGAGPQGPPPRPAAPPRAPDPERLAAVLAGLVDQLHPMTAPATLDGGDVMRLGRTLGGGRSARARGAPSPPQRPAPPLADDAVVGPAELLEQPALRGVATKVVVPPEEAAAGNVLAVGTTLLLAAGCPRAG